MDRGVQGKPLVSTKSQHGSRRKRRGLGTRTTEKVAPLGGTRPRHRDKAKGWQDPATLGHGSPHLWTSWSLLGPALSVSVCHQGYSGHFSPPVYLAQSPGSQHDWVTAEGSFAYFTNYGHPCLLPQPSRHSWEPFATFKQRLALVIEVPQPRLYMSLVPIPGCARTLSPWMYHRWVSLGVSESRSRSRAWEEVAPESRECSEGQEGSTLRRRAGKGHLGQELGGKRRERDRQDTSLVIILQNAVSND